MRDLLRIVALFSPVYVCGQDYRLYDASRGLVFASTDPLPATHSVTFDSVAVEGNDTVLYVKRNFNWLDDQSVLCPSWVGRCFHMSQASLFGATIVRNANGEYVFTNLDGGQLLFNPSLPEGDTMIIHEDQDQRFLSTRTGTSLMNVLGQPDSVRRFALIHQDANGLPIASAFNDVVIHVGKNLGLIDFFAVDRFPLTLYPVELLGMSVPALGMHRITNEMIYDHQPGDEIQTHYWSNHPNGPPWENFSNFRKQTVLSRSETVDSLIYLMQGDYFESGSSMVTTSTGLVKYHRQTVVTEIPFDQFNGGHRSLFLSEYCGTNLWTYRNDPDNSVSYCPYDDCWEMFDTQGPPVQERNNLVLGLGSYFSETFLISPTNGFSQGHMINYFRKNGIPCGTEILLGMNEADAAPFVNLAPNPTQGVLTISADRQVLGVTMSDASGRRVWQGAINSNSSTVDLSHLPEGLYHLELLLGGDQKLDRRVLLVHP